LIVFLFLPDHLWETLNILFFSLPQADARNYTLGISAHGTISRMPGSQGQVYLVDEQEVSRPTLRLLEGRKKIHALLYQHPPPENPEK